MMGTGKTAIGRVVASRAAVPFFDLDAEIVRRAGRDIPTIFADLGERAFRKLEREVLLDQLADASPRVVALGGGALLDRAMRLRVLGAGMLVSLTATLAELVRRLRFDKGRPLLDADLEQGLTELMEVRRAGYAEAHALVDTTGRTIDTLATELLALADLDPIPVPLGERTYAVDLAPGGAESALSHALARLRPTRVVYVTDEVV